MRRALGLLGVAVLVGAGCADEAPSVERQSSPRPQEAAAPAAPAPTAAASPEGPGAADDLADVDAPKQRKSAGSEETADTRKGRRVFAAVVSGLDGSLTQEDVTEGLAKQRQAMQRCVGDAGTRVDVSLEVGVTGEVGDAEVTRMDPLDVRGRDCVKTSLERVVFKRPGKPLKLGLTLHLDARAE